MKYFLTALSIFWLAITLSAEKIPISKICSENVSPAQFAVSKGAWCDSETFRFAEAASPESAIQDIEKRKKSALRNAEKKARSGIIQFFKDSEFFYPCPYYPGAEDDIYRALMKEITQTVMNGSVISSVWDDQQNCWIVFEARAKGFKKKVAATLWI